jgi:hypothetical protein
MIFVFLRITLHPQVLESFKVKVGVTDAPLEYRLRAREVSTNGDNCVHQSHLLRVIGEKL